MFSLVKTLFGFLLVLVFANVSPDLHATAGLSLSSGAKTKKVCYSSNPGAPERSKGGEY